MYICWQCHAMIALEADGSPFCECGNQLLCKVDGCTAPMFDDSGECGGHDDNEQTED